MDRCSLIGLGMYDLLFFLSSSSTSVNLGLRCGLGVDLITGIAVVGDLACAAPYSELVRRTGGAMRSGVAMRGINEGRPFDDELAPWWLIDGSELGVCFSPTQTEVHVKCRKLSITISIALLRVGKRFFQVNEIAS